LRDLPPSVVAGENDAVGVGRQTLDLLFVVILAAFLQSSAASMVDWVVSRWPREDRRQVRELIRDVDSRGLGYVRRSVLLAGAVAAVVASGAWAAGIPGAALIGVWVGAWTVVPWLGMFVALVPLVVGALVTESPSGWVLVALATALMVAAESFRARRIVAGRVRLGVAPSLLAVAVGLGLAGFGGVLVALVAVGLLAAAFTTDVPAPPLPRALAAGDVAVAPVPSRPTWPGELDGWRAVLTVVVVGVAAVLAWVLLGHLAHPAVWFVVAGMVAIALNRPVSYLTGIGVRRPLAVLVVLLVGVGVIAAAGVAGAHGGASTTSQLSDELPDVVNELEGAPLIGGWLRDHDADVWVETQIRDLPARVERARALEDWLPTIGARLVDLFWIVLLVVALLLDGPRLRAFAQRRVPAVRRRQFVRMVDVSQRAIGGYLAGAALVAGINAAVVFTIAVALGISLAPVLAVWAFIWNFVPQIGGFMGGMPLVVVALTVGPAQAVIAGLLFVAYQFAENHLIQPAIIGEAIDVPPWATLLTALAGGAAAGLLGAVVLTPLVGVIRVVLAETKREDFPGHVVPTEALTDVATEVPTVALR
jgi:predicted PurR-regulated permease PerM